MPRFLLILLALKLITFKAHSQCSVVVSSTNGYSVTVKVKIVSVIANPATSCPNGYNYNLALTYTITYTGTPPSNLYTFQGDITCNSSQSLFYSLPTNGSNSTGSYTTTTNPYITSDGTNLYTTHPSCSAANPSNLNCGNVTVHINGPGISDQTISCSTTTTLPVGLSDFVAVKASSGILLSWQTLTEINNDFFAIERSVSGGDWVTIGRLSGNGTTSQARQYLYQDGSAYQGINYYRLKQTDFDGSYNYSSVVYGVYGEKNSQTCSNISPNPTTGDINFEVYSGSDGKAGYTFINDMGASVKTGAFDFYNGTTDLSLSTEELKPGFYLLEINLSETTRVYRKIVKL